MTENQEQTTKQDHRISGGCHCGAVRFMALMPTNQTILVCNCSICSMTGFKHLIVPHQQFTLLSGHDKLTSYQFNTKKANHLFCSVCGVKSFYQPRSHPESWSINCHCLDDFNEQDWVFVPFDGKNWEQAHQELDK
ncbi:MAG: GFA family protein [Marinicella sp.]|nr:GFA family protein [Xanthomonadales bacterium]